MLNDDQLSALERTAMDDSITLAVASAVLASIVSDASDLEQLAAPLQDIARRYLNARRRSGEALLDAAAALTEARGQAQHGEWHVFLRATNTSDDAAERLLAIHRTASSNPSFAEAIRYDRLTPTTAALLARSSTPPAVREQVLAAPEPLAVSEVRQILRAQPLPVETPTARPVEMMTEECLGELIAIFDTLHDLFRIGLSEHIAARDRAALAAALKRGAALAEKGRKVVDCMTRVAM